MRRGQAQYLALIFPEIYSIISPLFVPAIAEHPFPLQSRVLPRSSFYSCISDLLKQPDVLAMKDIAQHADVNCLQHCLYVAYLSFRMCRFFHLDYHAAARGALLHDLFLYDWHIPGGHEGRHLFSHPVAALKNASRITKLNKKEENIILSHMWPATPNRPPHSWEAFLVGCADKLCAVSEVLHFYHAAHMEKKLNANAEPSL